MQSSARIIQIWSNESFEGHCTNLNLDFNFKFLQHQDKCIIDDKRLTISFIKCFGFFNKVTAWIKNFSKHVTDGGQIENCVKLFSCKLDTIKLHSKIWSLVSKACQFLRTLCSFETVDLQKYNSLKGYCGWPGGALN